MNFVIILILLFLSACFSGSETAFATVSRIRLKNNAKNGDKKAKSALKVADNYDSVLTAILIGNNIVNILMSSIGTVIATSMFGASGVAVATAIITVIVLIFGEIVPKTIGKNRSEQISYIFAKPLWLWTMLMTPVVWVFNKLSKLLTPKDEKPSVTEDELKSMIDEIQEEGVLEEHESDLVQNALDFDETTVMEICVPRVNIVAIEKDTPIDKIKKTFLTQNFSRLPVYEKNKDNIIGIITFKDFFRNLENGGKDISGIISDIIRISELQTVSEAFHKMQEEREHFAVVLDQYGGTRGIVTLEDILEELVGEIYDESDVESPELIRLRDNMYRVSGSMRTSDLLEKLNINDKTAASCSAVTVGGLIIELLGHIPRYGESIKCGRMRFRVIEVQDHSVKKLLLRIENI